MRSTAMWGFVPVLISLLIPCRASALTVGDIELKSHLNQPLDARINMLPDQPGDMNEIHIGLAPRRDFEKAGIEQRIPPDLIRFSIDAGAKGIPSIRLTSSEPIKEPLLDFIMEVTWPKGHLLREYTVLLDPPADRRDAPREPTPADGHSDKLAMGARADASPTAATPAAEQVIVTRIIEPRLTRDSYGPTMRPDTLWPIAKAVRPDDSVSIPQVMLALVRKNPEAFYNDNVNALKAGYVLRLPDKALINQVSEVDADREVKQQYRRWIQSRRDARTPTGSTGQSDPVSGRIMAAPEGTVTASAEGVATAKAVSLAPKKEPVRDTVAPDVNN